METGMRASGIAVCLILLVAGGCSSASGQADRMYPRIVDACKLIGTSSLQRYIGVGAISHPSRPPDVRPGDRQWVCSWGSSLPGPSLRLAEVFHSRKNGGTSAAARDFKFGRSTCRGTVCRELRGLGSEAFVTGGDLYSSAPSPANGSIDVYVRDANIEFTISYLPGANRSTPSLVPDVATNVTSLAREALGNLHEFRDR
ncbi:hypothetical protein ABZ914_22120 [Spirillospora sp. NPDC046719]